MAVSIDISATITVSVQRTADHADTFTVPYTEGMSILDALKWISAEESPDLAYRWECGGQRICGVCAIRVDGRPVLACGCAAHPNQHYQLAPLEGFAVEQDLVIDLHGWLDRLKARQPYLIDGGRPIASQAEADASKQLRSCIECWACVSVCPVSQASMDTHALGMVKLARFAADPRDGADRHALAEAAELDTYSATCPSCRRCADVCPKGIDVYLDAIQVLEQAI